MGYRLRILFLVATAAGLMMAADAPKQPTKPLTPEQRNALLDAQNELLKAQLQLTQSPAYKAMEAAQQKMQQAVAEVQKECGGTLSQDGKSCSAEPPKTASK